MELGCKNSAIFDICVAVSPKRCETGLQLLSLTNRKSHTSFSLVTKSMTLNDFGQPIMAILRYKHVIVACTFIILKPNGSTL